MALPRFLLGALVRPVEPNGTLAVGSQSSSTLVFNTDAKAATGTPTNPFTTLDGTATNAGNCVVVSVPDGANFLDLCVEYTGTAPTTNAVIRAYGEVPPKVEGGTDGIHASWPSDFGATFNNPGNNLRDTDWKPLGDMKNGVYAVTVGNASFAPAQTNANSSRTELVTINVAGAKRVIITISTAVVGTTLSMVVGWFGC